MKEKNYRQQKLKRTLARTVVKHFDFQFQSVENVTFMSENF
jgi:hypothetical protein